MRLSYVLFGAVVVALVLYVEYRVELWRAGMAADALIKRVQVRCGGQET